MASCLIMLTDNFPYDTGEEFIEGELPYVADKMTEVFVIPVRKAQGAKLTRSLPDNVTPILPEKPSPRSPRSYLFSYALRSLLSRERVVDWRNWNNPRRIYSDLMFSCRSLEVYDRISHALSGIDLRKYDSVVLYSYWFYTGVLVARQLQLHELSGVPTAIITRGHRYDVDESQSALGYLPARPYLLKVSDRLYPISDHASRLMQRREPRHSEKFGVRRLGVDGFFNTHRAAPSQMHVVSCSGLSPVKRVGLLADAIDILDKRGRDISWTHFGGVGAPLDELRARATKLSSVRAYFPGHVQNSEFRQTLSDAEYSAFINVSSSEGVPVTIMEAQASALPVIATDAGGTREIVQNGTNGILLPLDVTAEGIADAIDQLRLRSAGDYEGMSQKSLETARQLSDGSANYHQFAVELAEIGSRLRST